MKRNNKNKYAKTTTTANTRPFVINGVKDQYKDNPVIKDWVNYHTHGLSDYGLTELSVVCPDISDFRPCEFINLVGDMMLKGETFELDSIHCIDNTNNVTICKFMLKSTTCFGEPTLRIVLPDRETDMFSLDSPYTLQNLEIFAEYENIDE